MNRADHAYTIQLGREWEHLRRHRPTVHRARRWDTLLAPGPLRDLVVDLDDLQQLIDATRVGPGGDASDADRVLAALVDLSGVDELAGRVVVQRILGGLINAAVRYRDRNCEIDPAEIIVAAAWIAMRRYDTVRRPHHVAPSLISDAAYQAFRREPRRRTVNEQPMPADLFEWSSSPSERSAFERLADVVRIARLGGVPDEELRVLGDLVRSGSPTALAAERGVTTRTIRNHRERAVAHVRAAVLAA